MYIVVILSCLILAAILAQTAELRRFRTTEYEIMTDKVHHMGRLAVLADLHGFTYGKGNKRLLEAVRKAKPDVILIAGDLVVTEKTGSYDTATRLCLDLTKSAPVFYTFGNHETRAADRKNPKIAAFVSTLQKAGVTFLNNEFSTEPVQGEELTIYGLEVPMTYYQKGVHNVLPDDFIAEKLGSCSDESFSILLSHNPMFGEDYFAWGADLILSGHTHGGLVRFPGKGSLISPELTFFPKYDGGIYEKDGSHLIVSKGLGTHSFHIRIFDRAEIVSVLLKPQS